MAGLRRKKIDLFRDLCEAKSGSTKRTAFSKVIYDLLAYSHYQGHTHAELDKAASARPCVR